MLYDSYTNAQNGEYFSKTVLNNNHLYFIVIDKDNNVFGHYHPGKISAAGECRYNYDKNIFMFSLYSNGRFGVKKFDTQVKNTFTQISSDKYFHYCCGYSIYEGFVKGYLYLSSYKVNKINCPYSHVKKSDIGQGFIGERKFSFIESDELVIKRVIVLRMKDYFSNLFSK